MIVNIDFETYSECNLLIKGLWKYADHPSTLAICMAYSIDGDKPKLWKEGEGCPFSRSELSTMELRAYNVQFEIAIWTKVLQWPEPAKWSDTAAQAAMHSLPRQLGALAKALGLPEDKQKDSRGKRLIQLLCKPDRKGNRNTDPKLIKELEEYCLQDVITEQAVATKLFPLPPREQKIFELDLKINRRGLGMDVGACRIMQNILDAEINDLNDEVRKITKGKLDGVSSPLQVKNYLKTIGIELENYQKATLETALAEMELTPVARRLLEIRLSTGKTSTAKINKLLDIEVDGAAYGLLRYHGASTGRWSGNLFQPQNLPRPSFSDTDECIELIKNTKDRELLRLMYGDPMEAISSCIRGLIISRDENKTLICSDYSSIEPRVLAWLAGNTKILNVFKSGKDVYKQEACGIYGVKYNEVDKEQRFIGKIATLALGYGGGGRAFMKMSEAYGVDIDFDSAEKIKFAYRENNPATVQFWYACNDAALKAIKNKGSAYVVGKVAYKVIGDFLVCKLPSGRGLYYYKPTIGIGKFDNEEIRFWGVDSITRKFCEQSTYGGKLVENIVQAVARDIMADAMLKLESKGARVVLTVHDEVICEIDKDSDWTVEKFENVMTEIEPWAEGIPVEADGGFINKRYRK